MTPTPTMRFRSPVGDDVDVLWGGGWFDANPYLNVYNNGQYHTGADLNNNTPHWDADRGAPVYACADGVVLHAAERQDSWGNLVVIEHGDGLFSRYAHLADMQVQVGDTVHYGQLIGHIGGTGNKQKNRWPNHLHFDISVTDVLERNPGDWPGTAAGRVQQHYVDPKAYIEASRSIPRDPAPAEQGATLGAAVLLLEQALGILKALQRQDE